VINEHSKNDDESVENDSLEEETNNKHSRGTDHKVFLSTQFNFIIIVVVCVGASISFIAPVMPRVGVPVDMKLLILRNEKVYFHY